MKPPSHLGGSRGCNHKFVGSLGHTSENESGLIYMRARYYDPAIGRFISEDPGRNGANWYVYCDNNPVNLVDVNGESADDFAKVMYLTGFLFTGLAIAYAVTGKWTRALSALIAKNAIAALAAFAIAAVGIIEDKEAAYAFAGFGSLAALITGAYLNPATAHGLRTVAGVAVAAALVEATILAGFILAADEPR